MVHTLGNSAPALSLCLLAPAMCSVVFFLSPLVAGHMETRGMVYQLDCLGLLLNLRLRGLKPQAGNVKEFPYRNILK